MKKFISLILFQTLLIVTVLAQNTNLGTNAGSAGSDNTSVGANAGDVVTGSFNSFLGVDAGKSTTSGSRNSFLGNSAGSKNTTGQNNSFIGSNAGVYNTTGNNNFFGGYVAGASNTTGSENTFIGMGAGSVNTTGFQNIAIGRSSWNGSQGAKNIFVGCYSGSRSSGSLSSNNVMIGFESGTNSIGDGNIFLGYQSGYSETGSNKLYIDNSNTTTPLIFGDFTANQLGINSRPNTTHALTVGGTIHATGIYVNGASITDGGFEFWSKVGTNIWNNTGNVGIGVALNGTNNPNNYRLAVKGKIGAQEVQIENNSITWSDFVFNDDYKLMSLSELEQFIKTNNHLPEIPTQKEVRENGILLSEMNAKLLQKVEELTLYLIEMKKEIDILKEKGSK